jgi:hypothetical protein
MSTFDKTAFVQRAEEIVEFERVRHAAVFASWAVRANEFLENVRGHDMAAGNTEHEAQIMAWVRDHGVSLDWLLTGEQRYRPHTVPRPKLRLVQS